MYDQFYNHYHYYVGACADSWLLFAAEWLLCCDLSYEWVIALYNYLTTTVTTMCSIILLSEAV